MCLLIWLEKKKKKDWTEQKEVIVSLNALLKVI